MGIQTKVTPWLGFKNQAEEAATLYTCAIPGSRIVSVTRNPSSGSAMVVQFELGGLPVFALNTCQESSFTEAFCLSVACETQDELDRVWAALSEGGREAECGWLVDRFGVWWQVVPSQLGAWMGNPDPAKAGRTMAALLSMKKLNIAALKAAHDGTELTP